MVKDFSSRHRSADLPPPPMNGPAWGQSCKISMAEEKIKLGDGTVVLLLPVAGKNHKS